MFAAEVYDSPAWDKHKPHLHATHLTVPRHEKKEPTQLSPVKKRVKEGTPPTGRHLPTPTTSGKSQEIHLRNYQRTCDKGKFKIEIGHGGKIVMMQKKQ